MKPTRLSLAIAVVLALGIGSHARPAAALSAASSVDTRIRLDWQVGTGRGGRPVIQGYVFNDYGRPASDVHLLVETLDASGAVIGRTIGFVRGWSSSTIAPTSRCRSRPRARPIVSR